MLSTQATLPLSLASHDRSDRVNNSDISYDPRTGTTTVKLGGDWDFWILNRGSDCKNGSLAEKHGSESSLKFPDDFFAMTKGPVIDITCASCKKIFEVLERTRTHRDYLKLQCKDCHCTVEATDKMYKRYGTITKNGCTVTIDQRFEWCPFEKSSLLRRIGSWAWTATKWSALALAGLAALGYFLDSNSTK